MRRARRDPCRRSAGRPSASRSSRSLRPGARRGGGRQRRTRAASTAEQGRGGRGPQARHDASPLSDHQLRDPRGRAGLVRWQRHQQGAARASPAAQGRPRVGRRGAHRRRGARRSCSRSASRRSRPRSRTSAPASSRRRRTRSSASSPPPRCAPRSIAAGDDVPPRPAGQGGGDRAPARGRRGRRRGSPTSRHEVAARGRPAEARRDVRERRRGPRPREGAPDGSLAGSVSRRYARALFSIGVDRGNFEQLGKELDAVAELWDGAPELREALANPVFKASEKRAVMQSLLPRVAPTADVQKFVLLLLERRRLAGGGRTSRAPTARWRTCTRAACAPTSPARSRSRPPSSSASAVARAPHGQAGHRRGVRRSRADRRRRRPRRRPRPRRQRSHAARHAA